MDCRGAKWPISVIKMVPLTRLSFLGEGGFVRLFGGLFGRFQRSTSPLLLKKVCHFLKIYGPD